MNKKVTEPCGCWYKDSGNNRTIYKCDQHRTTPTDNTEWLDERVDELLLRMDQPDPYHARRDAIKQLIDTVCREARIKELEWVRGAGNDINYLDMDIVDRIAELVAQGEAPTPQLNPNKDTPQ